MTSLPTSPPCTITDVDGVRTIWSELPGPLRAGLIVRVGSADETFVTSGTTHLWEHLALFGIGRPGDHSNGFVDQTATMLHCQGDEGTVTDFLATVTRQLSAPPADRLAEEREVLRAEYAQRRGSAEETLLVWRYGCQSYGLPAGQAEGLHAVTPERLQAWARRYATRGNCVLWLSGAPPAGLRLHLPDGDPMPAPDPWTTVLPRLPAHTSGQQPMVALHAVVERGYVNQALVHLLQSRLIDELRTRRAVAYSPQVDYRPVTGDTGRLLAVSDLLPDRQSDGVRPFLAALQELAGGGVSDDEVAEWRESALRDLDEPRADVSRLVSHAWQVLFGRDLDDARSVVEQVHGIGAEHVVAQASAAMSQALALVPRRVRVSREPWVPAPVTVLEPVDGRQYRHLEAPQASQVIIVGEAGITLRDGEQHLTVTRESAAGVQAWPDGRRSITALDGNTVTVEPTVWADGAAIVAAVDQLWGPELVLTMPPRPVADIPTPRPAPAATAAPATPAASAVPSAPPGTRQVVLAVVGLLALGILGAAAVASGSLRPVLPAITIGLLVGLGRRMGRRR